MIFFIATIALFIWVAYTAMELRKATLAAGALLVVYTLIGDPSTIYISILWILFGLLVSLNIPEIRRNYITKRILDIYKDLGFEKVILKYSDRPDIRVGEDHIWDKSEEALLKAIKATNLEYSTNKGEGAFYGPKIEFVLRDAIGRDWQCGTLQVDLNLPGRLGASYVDKDGSKKVPVMLHRALFGSLERFIGILIENYSGKLPFWISPLQVTVIPVSNDFDKYAKEVNVKIKKNGISCDVDLRNHNLNYKIREHSLKKIPILLICGKKEVDSNSVTIRRLDSNKQENIDLNNFIKTYSALSKSPN